MRERGLANWALSMGRQRLGLLALQNHPQFLQNLPIGRLKSATQQHRRRRARPHPRPRARRAALQRVPPAVRAAPAHQLRRLHRPAAAADSPERGGAGRAGRRRCARCTAQHRVRQHQGDHDRRSVDPTAADQRLPRPPERQHGRQRRGPRHGRRLAGRDYAAARLRHLRDAVRGLHPERVAPALQRPVLHLQLPARVLHARSAWTGSTTTARRG